MGYIYMLKFPSGKAYVGQTIRKRVGDRWRAHKNRAHAKQGACRALNNAISKYGWGSVEKSVLEEVDDSLLNERERWWIAQVNSFENGYNLTKGGDENPMKQQSVRDRLKKTLSAPEMRARRSKISKAYHEDPQNHADWLEKHNAAHRTPEARATVSANNVKAWAKEGAREQRSIAIRKALSAPEMQNTKAERNAKMSATKAAKYLEKLAQLPPEEAARRLKASTKTARNRAIRKARMQSAPVQGRSTPPPATASGAGMMDPARQHLLPSDCDSDSDC